MSECYTTHVKRKIEVSATLRVEKIKSQSHTEAKDLNFLRNTTLYVHTYFLYLRELCIVNEAE